MGSPDGSWHWGAQRDAVLCPVPGPWAGVTRDRGYGDLLGGLVHTLCSTRLHGTCAWPQRMAPQHAAHACTAPWRTPAWHTRMAAAHGSAARGSVAQCSPAQARTAPWRTPLCTWLCARRQGHGAGSHPRTAPQHWAAWGCPHGCFSLRDGHLRGHGALGFPWHTWGSPALPAVSSRPAGPLPLLRAQPAASQRCRWWSPPPPLSQRPRAVSSIGPPDPLVAPSCGSRPQGQVRAKHPTGDHSRARCPCCLLFSRDRVQLSRAEVVCPSAALLGLPEVLPAAPALGFLPAPVPAVSNPPDLGAGPAFPRSLSAPVCARQSAAVTSLPAPSPEPPQESSVGQKKSQHSSS